MTAAVSELAGTRTCVHCGDSLPLVPVRRGSTHYCCHGCASAAELIHATGLDDYYRTRADVAPKPRDAALDIFSSPEFAAAHIRTLEDGSCQAQFQIGDVQCASCVWLNEKVLQGTAGVTEASVSFGTGVATVRWLPNVTTLADLAARVATLGYRPLPMADTEEVDRSLLIRLGVAGFCSANVMASHIAVYAGAFSGDMEEKYRRLFELTSLVIATPSALYAAAPIYERAIAGLRNHTIVMDLPIAAALWLMYGHGLWATYTGQISYLDSLVMLVFLLLVGNWAVARGRYKARRTAEAALLTAPQSATRRTASGLAEEVATDTIRIGDILVHGSGSKLCADGIVTQGRALVDLSHVTGESEPHDATTGEILPAGSLVMDGQIDLRVLRPVDESTIEKIRALVRDALGSKAPYVEYTTRLAPWFSGGVLVLGGAVYALNYWLHGATGAIPPTVSVLLVSCPCALAIAAPLTFAVGIGSAARRGAFVRHAESLDAMADIDRVAVDKTGTLTSSRLVIDQADDSVLRIAAALELGNTHPIARSVVLAARNRDLQIPAAENVRVEIGQGVRGTLDGRRYEVAGAPGDRLALLVREIDADGRAFAEIGRIVLHQPLRGDAQATLAALPETVILSGDKQHNVDEIASLVGIRSAFGDQSPADKANWIQTAHAQKHKVLFIGDGLNDAPALAAADVSVVMGEGAASALKLADVVMFDASLKPVHALFVSADETRKALRTSAIFSALYNTCTMTLAAVGWIGPLAAAVLMPLSSAFVITNAILVERRVQRRLK